MDLQQLSPNDANKRADDERKTIEFRGVLLRIKLSLVRLLGGATGKQKIILPVKYES
jgi:hypothetical protein